MLFDDVLDSRAPGDAFNRPLPFYGARGRTAWSGFVVAWHRRLPRSGRISLFCCRCGQRASIPSSICGIAEGERGALLSGWAGAGAPAARRCREHLVEPGVAGPMSCFNHPRRSLSSCAPERQYGHTRRRSDDPEGPRAVVRVAQSDQCPSWRRRSHTRWPGEGGGAQRRALSLSAIVTQFAGPLVTARVK